MSGSDCSWCRGNADGAGSVLQLSPVELVGRPESFAKNMFLQFEESATSPINKRDSIKLVATVKPITLPACTLQACAHYDRLPAYIPEQR